MALHILHALAQMQPAIEATGQVLQPLPAVHRHLTSMQCLPHLAQVTPPASQSYHYHPD